MKKLLFILLLTIPFIGFSQNSITQNDNESILKLVCESDWISGDCNVKDFSIIKSEEFFIVFCESIDCGCYQSGCPIFLYKKEKDQFIELDNIDYCFVENINNINSDRLIFECKTKTVVPGWVMNGGELIIVNKKYGKFEIIKGTSFKRYSDNEGLISPDSIE